MLKSTSESRSHLPVNIGFQDPQDDRSFECLMFGKFESGAFVRILATLESRGVRVLRSSFEASLKDASFTATLLVQLRKSDLDLFDLVEKVMQSRLVTTVEFSPRNKRLFSNYRFPINLVADKRAILIRADTISSLEANSRKTLGAKSDSIFYNQGRSYGKDLVGLFPKRSNSESEAGFRDAILEVTKATGWGLSNCEIGEDGLITYSLIDPPLDEGGNVSSNFLIGMIHGMMEQTLGHGLKVINKSFDKSKKILTLKMSENQSNY